MNKRNLTFVVALITLPLYLFAENEISRDSIKDRIDESPLVSAVSTVISTGSNNKVIIDTTSEPQAPQPEKTKTKQPIASSSKTNQITDSLIVKSTKKNAPPKPTPKVVSKPKKTSKRSMGYSYVVRGKRYFVLALSKINQFKQTGSASWYGPGFHGKKTANGERFNQNAMTAAHKTLPLGTYVYVTNLDNGQKIKVKINDRGPFAKGRIIDLSKAAADRIGLLNKGHGKVFLTVAQK